MKFNTMKKSIIALAVLSTTAYGASLEDRVEDLEFARDLNTWSFSGELESRYDYFNEEDKLANDHYNEDQYSLWARFDIHSKRSERLDFYGRLSMSKYFNDFTKRVSGTSSISDAGGAGRNKNGAAIFVERAFINYKIDDQFTFSIGRLPTIEGPSFHLQKGTARSGSYPQLAYGAQLDGMALTYGTKLAGGNMSVRAIYTPLSQRDVGSLSGQSGYQDSDSADISSSEDMYSVMVDYEKLNLTWANRFNFIGQYVAFNDFYYDATSNVSTGAGNPTQDAAISNLYFDYSAFVVYLEANGIANTGLDMGFTYKRTSIDSRGGITSLGGIFTNGSDGKNDGNVYMLDARYTFGKFKLGYELLIADEYAFTVGLSDIDAIGFYQTPDSTGHHVYASYDFDSDLRLILGYMMQQIDTSYTRNVVGAGTDADTKVDAGYARLIANF
ncbi:PF11853 family protein [Halobacteriovorax sp. BALOs_7]|uniref:DUF3373 family protein n=1 Tax=Halobacteriovorax sp. BALOs_7 TaxID=2109558 RepID=UPI000EA19D6D|nr:DUF3373 family protein [Halobacteriovorax sp. BALOs_7]AYF45340.1 PF11853 family protein [Halobacteriovorax sp. BALOs_7]